MIKDKTTSIVLINRIFTDYRKPIYDILSQIYNFKMLHSTNRSGIKQVITSYSVQIKSLNFSKDGTGCYLFVSKSLNLLKPKVVIHEFAIGILSMYATYLRCRLKNIKFILYSHGYNRKQGFFPLNSWRDKLRLYFLNQADAVIVYGQYDKSLLGQYINNDKIFVAQNTLDTRNLLRICHSLENEGKEKLKKRIGFNHKFNIVFIGRLIQDKRPEIVIDALGILVDYFKMDVALHYVGNGDMISQLKEKVKNSGLNDNVIFHGAIHNETITGEILYSADMMVMPGYLGLSVNHAFCFNCPVMSFEQQENGLFHSPEVEYVIDGETGFLLKNHTSNSIAEILNLYFNDTSMQFNFKENINSMVSEVFPVEKMVQGFEDAITYVLNSKTNEI